MKKLIIAIGILMISAPLAFAADSGQWLGVENIEATQSVVLDAPYLVRLGDNWAFGTELGKDLHNTSSEEGYFINAKVTYLGNWKSFGQST